MLTFIAFYHKICFGESEIFPIFALGNLLTYNRKRKGLHISLLIGFLHSILYRR